MIRWRAISEAADLWLASPWFFLAFNLVLAALLVRAIDVGNVFISIVTADAVLLCAAAARADRRAVHAKLDELVHSIAGAREALTRAEDRDEAEIEGMRR